MSSRAPTVSPFQHIWDDSARMAADGAELPEIVSSALSSANAQIEVDSLAAVPAHGRDFFSTLAKALAWAALLDVCVVGIGSFGAGPLSAVRLVICVVAIVWAVAFGTLAANQRVQRSRIRVAAEARTVVSRIAEEAAGLVWTSQVAGSWRPLGPPVALRAGGAPPGGDTRPGRWIRRLGGRPDAFGARLLDGAPGELLRVVERSGGLPVVLFRPEGATTADPALAPADDLGVAVFGLAGSKLLPGNSIAAEVWAAYLSPQTTEPPVARLQAHWDAAEPARRSYLRASR